MVCASGVREGGPEGAVTEATRDSVCEGGPDLDLYIYDGCTRKGRAAEKPRGEGHEEGRGHRRGQDGRRSRARVDTSGAQPTED